LGAPERKSAYLAFLGKVDVQMESDMRASEESPKNDIPGLEERLQNL
jgi:hypothetical protein